MPRSDGVGELELAVPIARGVSAPILNVPEKVPATRDEGIDVTVIVTESDS